jgi:hypothetical protein
MLVDLMTGRELTAVPYPDKFDLLQSRLSLAELAAIKDALNVKIEGTEIQTAGWMPGRDWSGTVFHPIWEKAANKNHDLSAQLFGLLVWVVFQERPERWSSGRFEKDGKEIGSRTYFRVS